MNNAVDGRAQLFLCACSVRGRERGEDKRESKYVSIRSLGEGGEGGGGIRAASRLRKRTANRLGKHPTRLDARPTFLFLLPGLVFRGR